ncbi:MAG: aconitase X swivel domain-containing protein [Candidatus Heimdallarchaeaceae archaeon]
MKEIGIRSIVEGKVESTALVSPISISFLEGVDPETGIIMDHDNPLFGTSIADKVFVFPEGKGSTVGSYVIYGLQVNGVAPTAFVVNNAEPIIVAGAILANIVLVDQPSEDIFSFIKTGDSILIDTNKNLIKIGKKE